MQTELNLHNILIGELKEINEPVALCLSSGVDSQSLLFALLELKKQVTVYSFTLNSRKSTDFMVAENLCKKLGVKFVPIYLPTDVQTIKKDVYELIKRFGCEKKTDVECCWPFLYVYKKATEKIVVTGIPADGHFCLSKKGMIHYKDRVDEFRRNYFSNPNAGQRIIRTRMAKTFGKRLIDPFYSNKISAYLSGYTWEKLNKPYQKMPIRNAFKSEFKKLKVRNHTNLQKGDSGISDVFEKLLKTELNNKNYKSVVGIYNQIRRDL